MITIDAVRNLITGNFVEKLPIYAVSKSQLNKITESKEQQQIRKVKIRKGKIGPGDFGSGHVGVVRSTPQ